MPVLLPDVTRPPSEPPGRVHRPPRAGWRTYRDCLRWEFGFTCAFCLVHEADLDEFDAARAGRTSIEHRELRSTHPELADDYANCFHACRFCSGARATRPATAADGRRLLDPCRETWAMHFQAADGRLSPLPGDRDAEYTHSTYRIDDARRVLMRRRRARDLPVARRTDGDGPRRIEVLLRMAAAAGDADRRELEAAARDLNFQVGTARDVLRRYAAVPADAPRTCRCGDAVPRHLPAWLAEQTRAAAGG